MTLTKIFISVVMFAGLTAIASAGQVTLTTYYPSPFGAYQQLRLVPTTQPPCDTSTEGLLFYESSSDTVRVCNGVNFVPLGGGVWTQTLTNIYPIDPDPNIRVGIGTTTPSSKLHVVGNATDVDFVAQATNTQVVDIAQFKDESGTNLVRIGASGEVYIQPNDPTVIPLEIRGVTSQTADILQVKDVVQNPLLFVTASGNVGIGTATPGHKLHIEEPTAAYLRIAGVAGDAFNFAGLELKSMTDDKHWGLLHRTITNNFLIQEHDGSTYYDRLTISPGGNVGIGTTSPGTNKLEVVGGPIKATGGLIIETRTLAQDAPSPVVAGQMWLCTDC